MLKIGELTLIVSSLVLSSSISLAVTPLGGSEPSGSQPLQAPQSSQSPQPLPSVGQTPPQFSSPPTTTYSQPIAHTQETQDLAFPNTPEGVIAALKLDQKDSELKSKTRSLADLQRLRAGALVEFDTNSRHMQTNTVELDAFGKALASMEPGIRVEVGGHTDSMGSDAYNMRLSEERAQTVKDFLVRNYGVDPHVLIIRGHGKNNPIASNLTEQGKQKNRRVEFVRIMY